MYATTIFNLTNRIEKGRGEMSVFGGDTQLAFPKEWTKVLWAFNNAISTQWNLQNSFLIRCNKNQFRLFQHSLLACHSYILTISCGPCYRETSLFTILKPLATCGGCGINSRPSTAGVATVWTSPVGRELI